MRFDIPGKCPSVANLREHWADKAKRTKAQRNKARLLCPKWTAGPLLVVELTRVAPRELDSHDNLRAALKGHVDGLAARLGLDDRSPLVEWRYRQEQGEECVKVWIRTTGTSEPAPALGFDEAERLAKELIDKLEASQRRMNEKASFLRVGPPPPPPGVRKP